MEIFFVTWFGIGISFWQLEIRMWDTIRRSFSWLSRPLASRRLMLALVCLAAISHGQNMERLDLASGPMELSGSANPWRFVNAVGEKAGVWGFENGTLEGWVYPLKIFHDFSLSFQIEGSPTIYQGEKLVRAVRVRPQSVELQYSTEQFTVTETLFTPRQEAGFTILLEAKTKATLRVFVRFRPDLNLMWPGSVGGQVVAWNDQNKWMELTEPSGTFSALVGSPAAVGSTAVGYHAYLTNDQPYEQIELRMNPDKYSEYIPIVVTAGIRDIYQAAAVYGRILGHLPELYAASVKHYAEIDASGPQFLTPDPAVNTALRWSRISLDQLKVCNPYLGCGYVSGYGSSGTGTRPMYAWFFDEPDMTERAFVESGGAESLRNAFRFIQKYQRDDGKIPHEISQSAGAIDWFKQYPYSYIHSDTSLWYLIAMAHFYRFTGDQGFLTESWPSVKKAYGYCRSMLNEENGLPQIPPGEWGSMETAGVATQDSAMAGEWIAALHGLQELATAMNDSALAQEAQTSARRASSSLEKLFWNPRLGYYNYGIGKSGEEVTFLNPTIAYSAWFDSLPEDRAQTVLERLAGAQFLSDWGVRSMSLEDPRYDENSYQIGSAWPFMTVAPMVADFRYHNAVQGFLTWTSMTHLRQFNARGAMPESLSGAYYQLLENGVPHQMFSELVAVPGLVDGVLGMDIDVPGRTLHLTPHLPPAWPNVAVRQFPFGEGHLDLELRRTSGSLIAELSTSNVSAVTLDYSPALPAGAKVVSVVQDGRSVAFKTEDHGSDVHVRVSVPFIKKTIVEVHYRGGISVDVPWQPMLEGDASRNLHILNSSYKDGQFVMLVEGRPELTYELRLLTPRLVSVEGPAESVVPDGDWKVLRIAAPANLKQNPDRAGYVRWTLAVGLKEK